MVVPAMDDISIFNSRGYAARGGIFSDAGPVRQSGTQSEAGSQDIAKEGRSRASIVQEELPGPQSEAIVGDGAAKSKPPTSLPIRKRAWFGPVSEGLSSLAEGSASVIRPGSSATSSVNPSLASVTSTVNTDDLTAISNKPVPASEKARSASSAAESSNLVKEGLGGRDRAMSTALTTSSHPVAEHTHQEAPDVSAMALWHTLRSAAVAGDRQAIATGLDQAKEGWKKVG